MTSVFCGQYSDYIIVPKKTIDFSTYGDYIIAIVPIGTKNFISEVNRMFDVFVSVLDVETGEIFVSSVSTDNLSRCFSDCMKCVGDHVKLLSFHALYRTPNDQDFLSSGG